MFLVAMLETAKSGSNCPSAGDLINNLGYSHSMKYFITVERNELQLHATAWMNLRSINFSEKSKLQEST